MGIGEKSIAPSIKAQEEYQEVLKEYTLRFEKRCMELDQKGIPCHLDGEDHFKDIGEWYKRRVKEIREKYLGE